MSLCPIHLFTLSRVSVPQYLRHNGFRNSFLGFSSKAMKHNWIFLVLQPEAFSPITSRLSSFGSSFIGEIRNGRSHHIR
jgi:hypothetical protein